MVAACVKINSPHINLRLLRFTKHMVYVELLLEKNLKELYFISTTKIGENTISILNCFFHDKFTLQYIRLTIQINKFTSYKQYSYSLLFSGKPRKTCTNESPMQVLYSVWEEKSHKTSKVATGKNVSRVCKSFVQLAAIKVFYSM